MAGRRLAWLLAGIAVVVGLAIAGAAWRGKQLAEFAVRTALERVGAPATALEVRDIGWSHMRLGPLRLGNGDGPTASGVELGWSPTGLLSGRIDRIRVEGLRLALAVEGGQIRVLGLPAPQGGAGGALPVQRLALAGAEVSLAAPAGNLHASIDAELTEAEPNRLDGRATIDAAWTAKGDQPLRLRLGLPQVTLALAHTHVALSDATVEVPEQQLAVSALAAYAGLAEGVAFHLSGQLRHTATTAAWPALTVTVDGQREADRITAEARAASADQAVRLTGKAEHNLANGRGQAEITLTPLRFGPGGRQPAALFPAAGGALTDVAGGVAAVGKASWDGRDVRTSLQIELDHVGFDAATAQWRDLTGRILLAPAWPPRTTAPQRLTGRLMLPGLPPSDLAVSFSLPADAQLRIDAAELGLAGGSVQLADAVLQRGRPLNTVLAVRALDLGAALRLLDIDGLSGSGTLDGAIPVEVTSRGVTSRNGKLAAKGPGIVRYTGNDLPQAITGLQGEAGNAIRLARQALLDFRYKSLALSIDRGADGQGKLLVQLAGSNPAVLDNRPFVLNIRLETNFDRLALLLLDGYAAAEGLLRRAARP